MQAIDIIGELYRPLLSALHVQEGDDGILKRVHGDNSKICEVNKRKLVLPTNANLQSLSDKEYMFFHPMSENFARGDSVIYNYLKTLITLRVNYSLIGLATVLLQIAGDKQMDGKLNSTQLELLTHIPKVDKKTVDNWLNAASKLDIDKNTFYSVYNKRNGKINGATFNRVAVVRFPLVEQLADPANSEYWSSPKAIRKADWVNYQGLMNYLLPNWDVDNSYSGYSDSMEAPSFHALVMAFVTIMERIGSVAHSFSDLIDAQDLIVPDLDKLKDAINHLQRYANIISPLDGNIGEVAKKESQANQIQQNPIGVPPTGLLNSADNKLNSYNTAPTTQQQHNAPQQTGWPQQQQIPNPNPPQNGGFIGFPQQPNYGYGHQNNGYPNQGYPQQYPPQGQPYPNQGPHNGGFIGYPQQQQYGYPQQSQQPPVNMNDPIQNWNNSMMPQQQHWPQQQQYGYPQQGQMPPQGQPYPNQGPHNGGFIGYPQQQQQNGYPPQSYYNAPQQTFRKLEVNQNEPAQQLPPTFKVSQ